MTDLYEKLQNHAIEVILGGLSTVVLAGLILAEHELVPYVSKLSPISVIRAFELMLFVSLVSIAFVFHFRPRLKFDSRLGVYRDRKLGLYYCPSCHTKKLLSPMQEYDRGWHCLAKGCLMFYKNPDYVGPAPQELKSRSAFERRGL